MTTITLKLKCAEGQTKLGATVLLGEICNLLSAHDGGLELVESDIALGDAPAPVVKPRKPRGPNKPKPIPTVSNPEPVQTDIEEMPDFLRRSA